MEPLEMCTRNPGTCEGKQASSRDGLVPPLPHTDAHDQGTALDHLLFLLILLCQHRWHAQVSLCYLTQMYNFTLKSLA